MPRSRRPLAPSAADTLLQRLALPEGGTPLTFDTFVAWKKAKLERLQVRLIITIFQFRLPSRPL